MMTMDSVSSNLNNLKVERKELKYYISYNEYVILSNFLRKILKQDKHNKDSSKGYYVRSLYFDTLGNKSFEDKMAGIEERTKYRIRVYNTKAKWVKFEIKSKFNNSVVKETTVIRRMDAAEVQNMNYEVMMKYNNPVLNKAYQEFKKRHYRPVVMIDYFREAFTYDLNKIRIVFDKFLKSTSIQLDIFHKDPFPTQKLKNGIVIMEIKYNNFIPGFLKQILQIPSFERSAISKYCIGRLDYFESIV